MRRKRYNMRKISVADIIEEAISIEDERIEIVRKKISPHAISKHKTQKYERDQERRRKRRIKRAKRNARRYSKIKLKKSAIDLDNP